MANICTIEGERKEGICAKMIVRLLLPLLARNRRENSFFLSETRRRTRNRILLLAAVECLNLGPTH